MCVCVCVCVCAHACTCVCTHAGCVLTAATTRVSDSQYWIRLCVSLAAWKAHFAVWTILVSLETMSIIFFLDASPGVFVLTSLGSLSYWLCINGSYSNLHGGSFHGPKLMTFSSICFSFLTKCQTIKLFHLAGEKDFFLSS